jgi:hypothetical protein
MRYEPSDECHACRPPKRYPGCHAVCPVGIELARLNAERYAETLTAVRAIPDHEATKKGRNEALRRQKNGRNPANR